MHTTWKKICAFIDELALTFEGRLGTNNAEIQDMKLEVLYKPLPTPHNDKMNLRADRKNVVHDLKTSLKQHKGHKAANIAHT